MNTFPRPFTIFIRRKLCLVAKAVDDCGFSNSGLKALGFIKRRRPSSSGYIFVNEKFDVVLKFPYLTVRKWGRAPSKYCIPTIFVKNPNYKKNAYEIGKWALIQPLANTRNRGRAYDLLEGAKADTQVRDFHPNNVAWYLKMPVIIDW